MHPAPTDHRHQTHAADSARESLRRSIPRLLTTSAILVCGVAVSALLSWLLSAGGDSSAATAFRRITWTAVTGLAISTGWLLAQLSRAVLLSLSDAAEQSSGEDQTANHIPFDDANA